MAKEARSLVDQTLGQFQIKSELGRGGMAVVYKGHQPSLDRWVAIKTLPMEMASDREMVSRFHREAEAMVALNHTNIVQIIDKGEDQGLYYFAMEFVEGPSLKDLLKQSELSVDLLFDIAQQVADGLGYAHKKGIVHRDVKPANILWETSTSLAKVADFGIARVNNKEMEMITLTANNVGMGTMNYMAPEQKTDAKAVDHRADIYALGVMIYEMFTGKLPMGKFKLPTQLNPNLPKKLDEVVSKCLETDPADRYQSMEALRADLQVARESSKGGMLARSVRDAAERTLTAMGPGGGGKLFAFCLVLLVLLGGGGGAAFKLLYWDRRPPQVAGTGDPKTPPGPTGPSGGQTKTGTPTTTGQTPPTNGQTGATGQTPPTNGQTPPPSNGTTGQTPPPSNGQTTPPANGQTGAQTPPPTNGTTGAQTPPPANGQTTPPANGQTGAQTPPPSNGTTGQTSPPANGQTPPQTNPQPVAARLSPTDQARFDQQAGKLQDELRGLEESAERAGLAQALAPLLEAARGKLGDGRALSEQGKAEALGTVETALRTVRDGAYEKFLELARRVVADTEAVVGPGRAEVDDAKGALDSVGLQRPEERVAACVRIIDTLRPLRFTATLKATDLALAFAELRTLAPARQPAVELIEAARTQAARDPDLALAKLADARARLLALRGPTPRRLRSVARVMHDKLMQRIRVLISICPAPDGGCAVLALLGAPGNGADQSETLDQQEPRLFEVGLDGSSIVVRRDGTVRGLAGVRCVAPAGRDAYWIGNLGGRVRRYRFDRTGLVADTSPGSEIDLSADQTLYDLDTGPDGRLHCLTKGQVRVFDASGQPLGGSTSIPRDAFFDSPIIPRRLAVVPGAGWIVAGQTAAIVPQPEQPVAATEFDGGWAFGLRGGFAGSTPKFGRAGLDPAALAAVGEGVLAACHTSDNRTVGTFHIFGKDLAVGQPLPVEEGGDKSGTGPSMVQDLAVSGDHAWTLDFANRSMNPAFRRRLTAYTLVE